MSNLHFKRTPARCLLTGQVSPRFMDAAYILRLSRFTNEGVFARFDLTSLSGRLRLDKPSGHYVAVAKPEELSEFFGICYYELAEITTGAVNAIANGLFTFDEEQNINDPNFLDQIIIDTVNIPLPSNSGNSGNTTDEEDDILIYAKYYLARMIEAGKTPLTSVLTP